MIVAASSLFVCLEFIGRHPGLLLVLIGVAGEIACDWKDMGGRLARAKRISAILLVVGLMMEFWEAAKSDNEVASTKERTALVESNNLVLKANVLELNEQATKSEKQFSVIQAHSAEFEATVSRVVSTINATQSELDAKLLKATNTLAEFNTKLAGFDVGLRGASKALTEIEHVVAINSNDTLLIREQLPRKLLKQQQEVILKALKSSSNENAIVVFDNSDWEARQFAGELIDVLKSCRFSIEIRGKMDGAPSTGLAVIIVSQTDPSIYPPGSAKFSGMDVFEALANADVPVTLYWQRTRPEYKNLLNPFVLFVGDKPR